MPLMIRFLPVPKTFSAVLCLFLGLSLVADTASSQVNLLLNRDYIGKVSEKQVMRVIEKGAHLNQVSTRYGHTPLMVMVDYRLRKDSKGTMRLIETMLERGADPNIPVGPTRSYNRDWLGSTVLHKAVEIGYKPLVTLLLEAGADPNVVPPVTGMGSFAPLHRAIWKRDFELVKLLLANGADPNIRQYKGSTYSGRVPLLTAILEESPTMVQILLDAGADPNIRVDDENWTALYSAVLVGKKAIVQILLEAGADPNDRQSDPEYGRTPLYIAALEKNSNIVRILLEGGADPNIVSNTGRSPLFESVISPGHSEIARQLLDYGADPTIVVAGETPLSLTAGSPATKCKTCTRSHADLELHALLLQYRK